MYACCMCVDALFCVGSSAWSLSSTTFASSGEGFRAPHLSHSVAAAKFLGEFLAMQCLWGLEVQCHEATSVCICRYWSMSLSPGHMVAFKTFPFGRLVPQRTRTIWPWQQSCDEQGAVTFPRSFDALRNIGDLVLSHAGLTTAVLRPGFASPSSSSSSSSPSSSSSAISSSSSPVVSWPTKWWNCCEQSKREHTHTHPTHSCEEDLRLHSSSIWVFKLHPASAFESGLSAFASVSPSARSRTIRCPFPGRARVARPVKATAAATVPKTASGLLEVEASALWPVSALMHVRMRGGATKSHESLDIQMPSATTTARTACLDLAIATAVP